MDSKEHKLEVAENSANCPQRMNTSSSQNCSLNEPFPPQNTKRIEDETVRKH